MTAGADHEEVALLRPLDQHLGGVPSSIADVDVHRR
jgi:hypothetical protein